MDPTLVAHVVNLVAGSILLLFSVLVGGRHGMPFFRPWTVAFGLVLAFLYLEASGSLFGRLSPILAAQALLLSAAGWWLLKTLRLLKEQTRPAGWPEAALGLVAAVGAAAALLGAPFELVLGVSFLGLTIPSIALGLYFLAARSARALGVGMIALGMWPVIYPYPLLVNTPYAWIGYAGSGLLHAAIGLGMIAFLFDESWRRYREEHEKLHRLRTDWVSIVSHELRTPITTVIGYAEFLADDLAGPLNEEQREFVSQIQGGAGRLRRLVDDLLHFSLQEGQTLRLSWQPVDLAARVRAVCESLKPQAHHAQVRLVVSLPDEPVALHGDPGRLEQVAANVITNAIKFTPEAGTVTVTVGAAGEEAWLTVRDAGIGIPEAELPHVFDMFYQGERSSQRARGGAGLGLAIAKAIADAHGGSLTCESAPGAGTTFRLAVPLVTTLPSRPALEKV
ncbi:MAG: sensor histidine kinase [Candidatus Sericytochromatia bacterium]